jgi:hypothetical protein
MKITIRIRFEFTKVPEIKKSTIKWTLLFIANYRLKNIFIKNNIPIKTTNPINIL